MQIVDVKQIQDVNQVAFLWHKLGHSPESVRVYRQWILQILAKAQVTDYQQLSADQVDRLARSYAREHHHWSPERTRRCWLSAFRAFAWGLKRLDMAVGSIQLSKKSPVSEPVMLAFFNYGQKLGWSPQTGRMHQRHLVSLRRFQARRRAPWPVPRLIDLDRFLQKAAMRWNKTTLAGAASAFRSWLRFLFVTGRSKHDLAPSVALPPSIAFPRPARALPWATVRQLGRGIDRSTPIGQRDYAQYLLFCAYGLSNAEMTDLKLEAIDWDSGILHIRRVKNSSTIDLPLLPDVAQAIAIYIRDARPQTDCRHVFVRHSIPFGPLSHSTIGQRVCCWAKRAGVDAPFLGVHLFRHSFATHQLERGLPLKVIGDILGHRSCRPTGVYVRTAVARLRQLALPVPS